ncbi:MAG: class I SAM-dependent methyltransferase [Acidimicrobiia bacterium]
MAWQATGTMSANHYFEPRPKTPSKQRSVQLTLPDLTLQLTTDRGMFSPDEIDTGTRVLLAEAPSPVGVTVALDLGCGYGPIACALATRAPGAVVWAIDVNERAVALCAQNAAANALSGVRAMLPDDVPDEVQFDLIWSNPPIRVGKAALHQLLMRWLPRLTPTGSAVLVVQKHLGSDSLATWLGEQDFEVIRLASRQAYRVLQVRRSTARLDDSGATS